MFNIQNNNSFYFFGRTETVKPGVCDILPKGSLVL
jgi:hypothetical protein